MTVYLKDIPLDEAKFRFEFALRELGLWKILGRETISLDENAIGRVLAEPIWAKISSPHYHASAMDGFAVRSLNTLGAEPGHPKTLDQFVYVDTGDVLPEGFDSVIPIENVESLDDTGNIARAIRRPAKIRIRAAISPWSHVRPIGEDIIQTQLVLPAGQVLRPVDLGAVAAAGHNTVKVARKPKVAILPTGSELVPLGSKIKAGDILEYNSLVLAGQVNLWGGMATRYPITPDRFTEICDRVEEAKQYHDLILINAGSSAGEEDFTSKVVEKLGTLLVHGVAVRPGHPVILGFIMRHPHNINSISKQISDDGVNYSLPREFGPDKIPIIGVPGYPVSAALTGEIFVEPLIAKWTGRPPLELPLEKAQLTRKITSPGGDVEYVRVIVGKVGERLLAAPLPRGAGIISSLVRADGLVILPNGVQGVEAGDFVDVSLYRSKIDIEKTIICIGSHDMTLDLLAQYISSHNRRFVSANVGSQGGLIALKNREAHLAGSHLLDPKSGKYNISYINRYLHGIQVMIFGFVEREQGLIVNRGNPKNIRGLEDLRSPDITFINRQRGAGTRVLLDYHLSKFGIRGEEIHGYEHEEYTHLGVAAAVASGRADCGLGIPAAAQSLDLEFIPLFHETYQLIIPNEFAKSDLLKPLFDILIDPEFQQAVLHMRGYNISQMGKLIAEI